MNTATATILATATKAALDYIRDDQRRKYALVKRAVVSLEGPGVGRYHYQDEVLGILSPTPNVCILTAEPFAAETGNWNGPDALPDNLKDGSFGMSLWHDLVVGRAKKIAKANTGATEQEVFAWANALVPALMELYAEKPPRPWWKRAVYGALEFGRPFYHPLKKLLKPLFSVAAVAASCGFGGCNAPPDWHAVGGADSTIVWELDGVVGTNAANAASDGWYGERAPDWFVQGGLASPGLRSGGAPLEFVTNANDCSVWR